jgi:hypothetical protein
MARKQQEPEQQAFNPDATLPGDYDNVDGYVDYYVANKMRTSDGMGLRYDDAQVATWQAEAREAWSAQRDAVAAGRELERQEEISREPIPYVSSFEDAVEQFGDELATIDDYEKLDDKEALIGKPFAIMRWWFTPSDVGERGEFAVLKIITKVPLYDPQGVERTKFTVVDGSTGIYAQLKEITNRTGKSGGLVCRNGLRASRYEYQGMPATTFYLT